jgi:alpha-tubulin suppressor-like RCC1 family protein
MTYVISATAAAVMCSLSACTSRDHPTSPSSEPASSSLFIVAAPANSGSAGVYVSLPPGSLPTGSMAQVSVARTGAVVSVPFADGGFDPVVVSGAAGDSIAVVIETSGAALSFDFVATPRKPPVIVRTNPPPNKRDVPLSTTVEVVFSEPIDGASLTDGSIQLQTGGAPVAGRLSFADPAHLTVVFAGAAPLLAATDYVLVITDGVRNLSSDALVAPMSVPFTTQATPAPPPAGLVFSSVSAGAAHTCALTPTGTAYCWGANYLGQLGTGNTTSSAVPVPVAIGFGIKFVQLSAGSDHTCGLTAGRAVYCWGDNYNGELGDGTRTLRTLPVMISSLPAFKSISAGNWLSCGLTVDGAAYCWGSEAFGQIGVEAGPASSACTGYLTPMSACIVPTQIAGNLSFSSVSAGGSGACGVTVAGAAYCWGEDSYGELGTGTAAGPASCYVYQFLDLPPDVSLNYSCSWTPLSVSGGLQFQDVHALVESACGLTVSGSAYCWGANAANTASGVSGVNSILGNGTGDGPEHCTLLNQLLADGSVGPSTVSCSTIPIAVTGGLNFVQLSSGDVHSCALTSGAVAYCWGDNFHGQLGNGTTDSNGIPTPVAGGLRFAAISAGKSTYTNTGTVYCWGGNSYGELGTGTTSDSNTPVRVVGQP